MTSDSQTTHAPERRTPGRVRPGNGHVPIPPYELRRLAEAMLLRPAEEVAREAHLPVNPLRRILDAHLDSLEAAPPPDPPTRIGLWQLPIGRHEAVLVTGSFPTRVIAVLPLRGLRAALADRFTEQERQRVQEVWVSLVGRVHEAARPLFRHAVFNHDPASPLRQLDVAVAVVRRALGIPPSAAGNRTSHAARHTPPEFAEAILLADQLRMALFLSALGEFSMYYEPWLVDVASSPRLVRSVFAGCVCEPFGRWGAESLGWYYPLSRIFLDYCTLREVERAAFRYASLPPKVARRYLLHSAQILAREQRGPHTEADLGVKVYFADVGGDTFAFSGPAERHAASAPYECALGPGDHTATRPGGVSILSFFEVSKRLGRAFAVLESGRCVSRAEFLYRRALGQTEEPPGWYREAEQNVTASR